MSLVPAVTRNAPELGRLIVEQDLGTRATWIHASGELDLATAPLLERALDEAHRDSLLVVLEPRGLTFIDCAGLRVILEAAARARRRQGWLLLVASSPVLENLLALTGLQDLVTLFDLHPESDTFGRASTPRPRARRPAPRTPSTEEHTESSRLL